MNRRWVVLALVFFGIVISYVDRGNLSIAAPSIMREFRIEPSAMGVLLSAFFWTYGTFQIPGRSTGGSAGHPARVRQQASRCGRSHRHPSR